MYKKLFLLLSSIFFLLFINSCEEIVYEPCGKDIEIKIVATVKQCNEECIDPAQDADISISQTNSSYNIVGKTNLDGEFTFIPPKSGCGVSNLSLYAVFNNRIVSEMFPYICNDTTIYICFDLCQPDTVPTRNCDDLNQTDFLNFKFETTSDGCIPEDAIAKTMFAVLRVGSEDIRIEDLNKVLAFEDNKFKFSKATESFVKKIFENNGPNAILRAGSELRLGFDVNTDGTGTFNSFIEFDLKCVNQPTSIGKWRIELNAVVCETPCDCPFNEDDTKKFISDKLLKPNEVDLLSNQRVLDVNPTLLKEGCYISINEIIRIDNQKREYSDIGLNNDPYQYSNQNDVWRITSQVAFPRRIDAGGRFNLSFEVKNPTGGFLRDTFRIKTTVHDKDGNIVDPDCRYDFYLEARGCEDVCAVLEIKDLNVPDGSKKITVKEINTQNVTNIWDEVLFNNAQTPQNPINMLNYYNHNELFVKFYSDYKSNAACLELSENIKSEFEFDVKIDKNVLFCDRHQYELTRLITGEPDSDIDNRYFNFDPPSRSLAKNGDRFNVRVVFIPPSASELEQLWNNGSKPPNDSTFKFRLQIWNKSINCHIVLNFEAKVNGLPPISPKRHIDAFNRITTKRSTPNYFVANIKEKTHYYHSKTKNLIVSNTKFSSDPPNNSPNTNDNFYINVDTPKDIDTIGEYPELYLVQTQTNIFNRITTEPIARYNDYDEFEADLGNLINAVFNGSFSSRGLITSRNFTYDQSTLQWNNSADKADFDNPGIYAFPNGIELRNATRGASSVYMIWSTNSGSYFFNGNRFPCELAFIFIDEIQNGEETDNSDRRAKILFNVVYPIYK